MRKAPEMPFPTAGELTRLNGRYALCTHAGLTLTAFDWELEVSTEFVDATGHGDIWDVPVPLKYSWTARVRGYYDTSNSPYMHLYNGQITGAPPPDITAASFVAYKDDVPTTAVFTGLGLVVRARWSVPNALVEQELELRGTGVPTVLT
jgi:hypothetical protein